MILTPVRDWAWVASDIAAEERRKWQMRLHWKAARLEERAPDDTNGVEAVFLPSNELVRRKELLARAKQGDQEAADQLWRDYRCRVVRP